MIETYFENVYLDEKNKFLNIFSTLNKKSANNFGFFHLCLTAGSVRGCRTNEDRLIRLSETSHGHRNPTRSILMEADCFDSMDADVNFLKK